MKEVVKIFLIGLSFIIIVSILFLSKANNKHSLVCFKKNCFKLEVADTPEERRKGLMFRRSLDKNKGMLFVFKEEGIYPFWMKNTKIPLDIIWLDKEKRVIFIKNNALPCDGKGCALIYPDRKAMYVLEINANMAKSKGIHINDKADFYNID